MAPKRKRSSLATAAPAVETPIPLPKRLIYTPETAKSAKRRRPSRANSKLATNADVNSQILDSPEAARASPDGDVNNALALDLAKEVKREESPLSDLPDEKPVAKKHGGKKIVKTKSVAKVANVESTGDPEDDDEAEAGEEEIQEAMSRPPAVNSEYLPLPWKGRLGYVGLHNTRACVIC